jgi:hypothetical protein
MADIPSNTDPNGKMPHGNRMCKEDGNLRVLDDTFDTDSILKVKLTDGTDIVDVNDHGHLSVYSPSEVIIGNSTSTPLNANVSFTGSSVNILEFAIMQVNVYSDVASATDGLDVQFSSDGTNWDISDVFTIPAASGKVYSFQPAAQYMRVVYTNGGSNQTEFRLQVIGSHSNTKPSSHRIQDAIIDDDDAELVTSVLKAKFNGAGYGNIGATASGNLRTTDAESGLAIASGDVVSTTYEHKFGNAPDFDTADGVVTVWDGADDSDIGQMVYQYSSTADIDRISSSSASDTFNVKITGLDTNYDLVTQTITLTGQTSASLTTSLIRIFRMENDNSSDNVGHIYCFVNSATTNGVPNDSTKVRAVIQPGNNQTLMAVYTVPAGYTAYMRDYYCATAGANKSSNYPVELRARKFGKVFNLKHKIAISDTATGYLQHRFEEPEKFLEKTDLEIRVSATAAGATEASISAGFDIVLKEN